MSTPDRADLPEPQDDISERAAAFFEQRHFGSWNAADRAELDAWLAESVLHEVAYLRVEGATALARELAGLRAPRPLPQAPARESRFAARRFVLPLLAAASVALFAALGIPFVTSLMQPPDRVDSTDVGGRTLLSFSDRTQIELNTDTAIRFRMTGEERTVWLERGEAWFRVSHDASRPFNVVVGKHRIVDLGTEFVVRRDADAVDVALVKGRAALSAGGVQTATLNPGDEAVATPVSLTVTRKTPQELADALAWRRGVLVFRKTKLADVVREFNRYNTTKLVIADPSIAGETISADIKIDAFEDFLNLARTVLNLRADREGGEILISRETKKPGRHAP